MVSLYNFLAHSSFRDQYEIKFHKSIVHLSSFCIQIKTVGTYITAITYAGTCHRITKGRAVWNGFCFIAHYATNC